MRFSPPSGLTLVKGGGGGGGGGFSGGGGHMGGGGAGFAGGHVGGGGVGLGGASGGGRIGGDAGPHFSGGDHIGGVGGPRGGMRYGANDHVDNGRGHFDHDHFDHDHGRHVRFFPGDAFFYGGDYADYGALRRRLRLARAASPCHRQRLLVAALQRVRLLRLGSGPALWRDPFRQRLTQARRGEGDEALHFRLRQPILAMDEIDRYRLRLERLEDESQ